MSHLNECWLAVEEEIVFLWNKYAVQRKNTRDNEIEYLLLNASIYDERCLNQCRSDILIHVDEFDIELVSFKESYFMCVEGRDIYMPFFLEDGSLTLYRKGVLDEDNDTILHDRHSWWKEIYLSSGEICSVNPSTNAIYKYWSYQRSNIIGVLYNNEIVLF